MAVELVESTMDSDEFPSIGQISEKNKRLIGAAGGGYVGSLLDRAFRFR